MFAFAVLLQFFCIKPRDWLRRTSPKWPILCRVVRKATTRSIIWVYKHENVVKWCGNWCRSSSSTDQSSVDISSPSLHEPSIASVSSVAVPGEAPKQLETIHEDEDIEAWVHHLRTFQLSRHWVWVPPYHIWHIGTSLPWYMTYRYLPTIYDIWVPPYHDIWHIGTYLPYMTYRYLPTMIYDISVPPYHIWHIGISLLHSKP